LEVIDFHSNYLTTINNTKLERTYFPPATMRHLSQYLYVNETKIDLSDNCLSFDGPPVATPTHCKPTAAPTVAPSTPVEATSTPTTTPTEAPSTMTPSALPTTTPTQAPSMMTPSALPTMGSLQDDIDKEGQACAAMAAALPQLQTNPGRNDCKQVDQYHI
jgi:hypothetical protein